MKFLTLSFLFIATSLRAATLPGFRIETVATVPGVVSSLVSDSHGTIYCTTTSGSIYRIDNGVALKLTSLNTHAGGNGGLLGMALVDDHTAAVHYTTWSGENVLDDVLSLVDLTSGVETVLHTFVCDIEVRERGASAEHHGGNPTIAPDGAIFVGIGEYNTFVLAQEPEWNGGKIFRIDRDGNATQFARGVRNPYDLAWDPDLNRLVFTDNGPDAGDEVHVINEGANAGWPDTVGDEPQINGSVAPVYVFPVTVAPTGLLRLTPNSNALLRRGYISGAFVARSLFYFPDLAAHPVADPYSLVGQLDEPIIDVAQTPNGEIYFSTVRFPSTSHIQHLIVPKRGDCDGDGNVDWHDIVALNGELGDAPEPMLRAQDGTFAGTWGCDVNADGTIDKRDLSALTGLLTRHRAVASH